MTEQQPTPSGNRFRRAIAGIFRFLVRLLLLLIVGLFLGAGLYFGVPWAYRNLVQPVQENIARVAALEHRIDQEQDRLQEENHALQERITALETRITQLREAADVQTQDRQALEERTQQLEESAAQVEGDLETQQQDMEAMRSELEANIAALGQQTESTQGRLDDAQGQMNSVRGQMDDLEGRLVLLQTAQDLLKVRLLLLEENPRAAREVVGLAVAHLERASELMPAQAETLDGLRERMAALDGLIAARSYRVRPDLEALWADVMDLVAPPASQPAVTSTSTLSPVPTPTPSP